jgi:hypothetical protein
VSTTIFRIYSLECSEAQEQIVHTVRSFPERISTASDDENEFAVPRFTIDSETNRQYSRINAVGTELTVRLLPPAVGDDSDAITPFQASVNDLFDYVLRSVNASDMVGLTIHNEVNMLDKAIGISFRRNDQLSEEVIGLFSVK